MWQQCSKAVEQTARDERFVNRTQVSRTTDILDPMVQLARSFQSSSYAKPPPSTVAVINCERLATGPGVHQYINRTYIPQRRVSENEAATRPGWKTTVQVVTASHTPAGTWQLYTYQAGSDSKRHGHSAVWTQVSRTTSRIRH